MLSSRLMPFADLQEFVRFLELQGQLKRVRVEVDPELEVTEIIQRVVREQGPALLFERPKGSSVPLLMNLSEPRIACALPWAAILQKLATIWLRPSTRSILLRSKRFGNPAPLSSAHYSPVPPKYDQRNVRKSWKHPTCHNFPFSNAGPEMPDVSSRTEWSSVTIRFRRRETSASIGFRSSVTIRPACTGRA